MEIIVMYALVAAIASYAVLELPAQRIRKQLTDVATKLKDIETVSGIDVEYGNILVDTKIRAYGMFWLTFIMFHIIVAIGYQLYAYSVEPRANFGFGIISIVVYSPAMIVVGIFLSRLIAAITQGTRAGSYLRVQAETYPNEPVLQQAYEHGKLRKGEVGGAFATAAAIIVSIVYGLWFVFVMLAAAESAIACARSSKCM
jgi:hypothetical protein